MGLNGTCVCVPQAEQVAGKLWRGPFGRVGPPGRTGGRGRGGAWDTRLRSRQAGQRLGSPWYPRSTKACCCATVNSNSAPHSMHNRVLSTSSMMVPHSTPAGSNCQAPAKKPRTGRAHPGKQRHRGGCNCVERSRPAGRPTVPAVERSKPLGFSGLPPNTVREGRMNDAGSLSTFRCGGSRPPKGSRAAQPVGRRFRGLGKSARGAA